MTSDNLVHITLVTTRGKHLVGTLADIAHQFHHFEVDSEPMDLGFATQRFLADNVGLYDWYAYLEDDLVIRDGWILRKLRWFVDEFGEDALLQPNRYEVLNGVKVYIDGPLIPEALAGVVQPEGPSEVSSVWGNTAISFQRPSNPHAGCFFLTNDQLTRVLAWRDFGQPNHAFVGPLESAATHAVASNFRVYKAAAPVADFIELEHPGHHYLDLFAELDLKRRQALKSVP